MPLDGEEKELLEKLGSAWEEFRTKNEARIDELEKKLNRPGAMRGVSGAADGREVISSETKAAVNAALRDFLKSGDPRALTEAKGMSVGIDPDGGYLTVPYVAQQVRDKLRELDPIRQHARVITIPSGDAFEEPREDGDAGAEWAGEVEERSETAAPSLGLTRIPLHEIYAKPKVTQKLLDTASYDVAGWLSNRLASRFARTQGAAFVTGNGVKKPRGFTDYPTAATADDARAWGVFEHVATGVSGAFAGTNPADALIEVQAKLKTGYLSGAAWFMPRSVAALVRKFKETTGGYIWQPSLQAGQPPTLMGYPVVYVDSMPAAGANSLSIAFGNMEEAYTITEKGGFRLLADPYTAKPHVVMYAYTRVGGDVADFEALKFLKFGTS